MITTMITTNGGPIDSGCYVDGHVGHYLCAETLRIAARLLPGHVEAPTWRKMADQYDLAADQYDLAHDPFGDDYEDHKAMAEAVEASHEMADEAVEFLNDATKGGTWGFEDGELFLRSDDELVDER